MITGKLYEYLKWLAQILLPAIGTLYIALAALWDLPKPQEVAGSILAVDFFLGTILGISQVAYNRQVGSGVVNVLPKSGGGLTYDLALDDGPEKLKDLKEVRFKVNNPTPDDFTLAP